MPACLSPLLVPSSLISALDAHVTSVYLAVLLVLSGTWCSEEMEDSCWSTVSHQSSCICPPHRGKHGTSACISRWVLGQGKWRNEPWRHRALRSGQTVAGEFSFFIIHTWFLTVAGRLSCSVLDTWFLFLVFFLHCYIYTFRTLFYVLYNVFGFCIIL